MPTKTSADAAKPRANTETAKKLQAILRKAQNSSDIVVVTDNISGRAIIMVDDLSGRASSSEIIVATVDNISGRAFIVTTDNLSGRLCRKYLRGAKKVELDAGETERLYRQLLTSLSRPIAAAAKSTGAASKSKTSTKRVRK